MEQFDALVHPTRRDIVALLRGGEQGVDGLVAALDVPQPSVSKHLKILRDARLVQVRVEGPRRLYSLDPAGIAALDAWLAPFRAKWADKLDALTDHLKRSD